MAKLVVGLGEILWDLLPDGKQLGGAPANFAYYAGTLGSEAVIASRVGDDELGREVLLRAKSLRLGCACLSVDGAHPTGTVSVTLDSAGSPRYVIHEGVAWDFIETTPELLELAARADAVCYGTLCQRAATSRATIRAFLAATRADCLRVFDINLRQSFFDVEVLETSLRLATVVKLNDEELPVVAETMGLGKEEKQFAEALRKAYGVKLVALTRGGNGSVLLAEGRRSEHPGIRVEVTDTIGAGDAFTAAVARGLLDGDALDTINERANRLAAHVCTQKGAMPE